MNATVWDEQRLARMNKLRADGVPLKDIANRLGVKQRTLERRLYWDDMTPDKRKARRDRIYQRRRELALEQPRVMIELVQVSARPTPEQIRDRDLRMMMPPRDFTALFCGDPPIGRSALDMKQGANQ